MKILYFAVRGPGGRLLLGIPGSAVADCVHDFPRGPAALNGTGLTKHPVLGGLDRAVLPDRPCATRPLGAAKSAQPAITHRVFGVLRPFSLEVQQQGCCMRLHNPPREGFRPGRPFYIYGQGENRGIPGSEYYFWEYRGQSTISAKWDRRCDCHFSEIVL